MKESLTPSKQITEKKIKSLGRTEERQENKEKGMPTFSDKLELAKRQENLRKIEERKKEEAEKIKKLENELIGGDILRRQESLTPKKEQEVEKSSEKKTKLGEFLDKLKKVGKRTALWTAIGTSTISAILPKEAKAEDNPNKTKEISVTQEQPIRKPGEVHPKYPWMERDAEGKWPKGSIPYNEELKAGLYKDNSINFEQAKNNKDLEDPGGVPQPQDEKKEETKDSAIKSPERTFVYDKHPELFKKIPEEKYKNVTDYLDKYYSSDFTKEKLKAYFPNLNGPQLEDKVNEILNKAKEDIHNKKFYIVSRENMTEAEKIEPFVSYFLSGYAGGLSLGEIVLFSPDIQEILLKENIAHEMGHHIGLVKEDGSKKDFLDTSAKQRVQFKYSPIPLIGKDLPYPLSIRSYVIDMPGEMKSFLDELRVRYNLDSSKKITKEDMQKKGVYNNYRWRQLREAYSEDDLINMFNEIVENKSPDIDLDQDNVITEKPEGNIT